MVVNWWLIYGELKVNGALNEAHIGKYQGTTCDY